MQLQSSSLHLSFFLRGHEQQESTDLERRLEHELLDEDEQELGEQLRDRDFDEQEVVVDEEEHELGDEHDFVVEDVQEVDEEEQDLVEQVHDSGEEHEHFVFVEESHFVEDDSVDESHELVFDELLQDFFDDLHDELAYEFLLQSESLS